MDDSVHVQLMFSPSTGVVYHRCAECFRNEDFSGYVPDGKPLRHHLEHEIKMQDEYLSNGYFADR